MPTLLFVCSENTCRSPMAAAIAKDTEALRGYECISAGINEFAPYGEPIKPEAHQALKDIGCQTEINDPEAKKVNQNMLEEADIVFCLGRNVRELMIKEFPKYKNKFVLYSPATDKTPDPYDLQGFTKKEIKQKGLVKQTQKAYTESARKMKELFGEIMKNKSDDSKEWITRINKLEKPLGNPSKLSFLNPFRLCLNSSRN